MSLLREAYNCCAQHPNLQIGCLQGPHIIVISLEDTHIWSYGEIQIAIADDRPPHTFTNGEDALAASIHCPLPQTPAAGKLEEVLNWAGTENTPCSAEVGR